MGTQLLVAATALCLAGSASSFAAPSADVSAFVEQTLGISSYKFAEADLNDDGKPEAFLYVTEQDYCGSGGCNLIILSPKNDNYEVVLRSTVAQLPIHLLSTSTRGWRDVGVTVAGGGITRAYMARLRFDGSRYPSNPTVPPALRMGKPSGRVLIPR